MAEQKEHTLVSKYTVGTLKLPFLLLASESTGQCTRFKEMHPVVIWLEKYQNPVYMGSQSNPKEE